MRLGHATDASRYHSLAVQARSLYQKTWYNSTSHCYYNCTYLSQLLALTLVLVPRASAAEAAVWQVL